MGRKPLPDRLKKLKGTYRPSRSLDNSMEDAVEVVSEVPAPPDWLDEVGKEEWRRVAEVLHNAKILTPVDFSLLAMYCNECSIYIRAQKELNETGRMVEYKDEDDKTKHTQRHALQLVADNAFKNILKIGSEFGFSPSARTHIPAKYESTKTEPNPLEGLIRRPIRTDIKPVD